METGSFYPPTQLPEHHSESDSKWIVQQLDGLSRQQRERAVASYSEIYRQAFDLEPVDFRKENKARREANTRLRLFVVNCSAIREGRVSKPKLVGE